MAPSILSLGTAALAFAGNAAAAKWYLADTYDSTNFFDKFNFFTDISPNNGYVNFLGRSEAISKGLAKVDNGEVIIKVDNTNLVTSGRGRNSVRLESKDQYNKGLIIGRFSHLPENKCSTWPAFWTVGNNWPYDGEVDMLEGWNNVGINKPAFHMGNAGVYGSCSIEQTGQSGIVGTSNCDNLYENKPFQYSNQGCVTNDGNGPWATANGGVYAMEWTSDYIRVFSWKWNNVPKDVASDSPDTSTWGTPTMALKKSLCNIDKIFKNQRIILNIDLCGNPVQEPGTWDQCGTITGKSCRDYVAKTPAAFDNVYFKVKDIRIFSQNAPKTTTTSSTKTSTTSSTKTTSTTKATSTTTSTTKTTSSAASSTTKTSSSTASSTTKTSSSTASSTTKTSSSAAPSTTKASSSTASSTTKTSSSTASSTTASSTTKVTSTTSSTKTVGTTTSTTSKDESNKTTTTTSKAPDSTTTTTSTTKAPVTTESTKTTVDTTSSPVTHLTTSKWSNHTTSSVEMTTSTVYTTAIHTITSCKPTITNCPIGKVTTVTIPLYTTVCPVSAVKTTAGPKPTKTPGHGGQGSDKTTITTKVTKTYTITSCAPTVTNCPVGKVTTEVVTTTYCPGEETQVPTQVPTGPKNGFTTQSPFHPSKTVIGNTETVVPKPTQPSNWNNGTSNATSIVQPRPTGSQIVCVGESCGVQTTSPTTTPAPGNQGCTGPNCPPTVVSGAGKQSLSALVVLGAVAAMML